MVGFASAVVAWKATASVSSPEAACAYRDANSPSDPYGVLDAITRASEPNCNVLGTNAVQTLSAALLPSVSTKCESSSRTRQLIGQPRPPLLVQGNAAIAVPTLNVISSS